MQANLPLTAPGYIRSMSEVSQIAFLALAPIATGMLAVDLRRRIAAARYRSVSQAEHPIQYWAITAMNMLVVVVCWYEVADLIAKRLR